jgi:DNA-binding response OmpR family regulator
MTSAGKASPRRRPPAEPLPIASASSPPHELDINLQSPGIVHIRGSEVRLTPLGFDLLAALAERPGEVVTREALYCRLWPEGGPEEQQLDAHRRRLVRRLRPVLGPAATNAIEVVRGLGFRLAVSPATVRLRGGSSPDESRCLRASPGG